MNKQLSFIIENQDLYLEQVLVDYMDIPIFFLCKAKEQYYIALCTNIDDLNYIVTKLSLLDVYNLLHGKTPMRDVMLKQNEYWDIASGDEIILDVVIKKCIKTLNHSLLPEAGSCFEILTKQMKTYVQEFDEEFFCAKYFSLSNKTADLHEFVSDFTLDILLKNIDQFTGLADCKIETSSFPNSPLYNEIFLPLKTIDIVLENSKQTAQTKADESFKLVEAHMNYIPVAA